MIYKDKWLAYDVVVDSHSGLTQETTAHSLVRIVDPSGKTVAQQASYDLKGPDSKVVALHRGAGYLHVAADLTAAYGGQAAVQQVQREIVYLEPSTVIVYDRLKTTGGNKAAVVFQLVSPVATLSDPPLGTSHAFMAVAGHTLTVEDVITPPGTVPTLFDFKKGDSTEFNGGFRLDETAPGGTNIRFLHVLTIDGSATGITSSGSDGVTMMVGGKQVTMAFNHDAIGGTLNIGGQQTTLGAVVEKLPE